MRREGLAFVGVGIVDKEEQGTTHFKYVYGIDGFRILEDTYNKKNKPTKIAIIFNDGFGSTSYANIVHLNDVSMSAGIPFVSFNTNITCDDTKTIHLTGWGIANQEEELIVDHYEYNGDTFKSQTIANLLAESGRIFSIYGKDGKCIRAKDIRVINFPHKEERRTSGLIMSITTITTTDCYILTYSGVKYTIVRA